MKEIPDSETGHLNEVLKFEALEIEKRRSKDKTVLVQEDRTNDVKTDLSARGLVCAAGIDNNHVQSQFFLSDAVSQMSSKHRNTSPIAVSQYLVINFVPSSRCQSKPASMMTTLKGGFFLKVANSRKVHAPKA